MNDTTVLIIGSGFGASVAALRFSESGKQVVILERGGRITRERFEADDDMLWQPEKGRYGMNDFRKRGEHILPWLGVGVGGGSHVYAGTLKRREFFSDFPSGISVAEMKPYYERAEQMMQAVIYPDYPPYNQLPSYKLFRNAEKKMKESYPHEVEKHGDIFLGISFAPEGGNPGTEFINIYGANQRYSDPQEQKLLGGDIEVKNSLDKNYLFLAEKHGAVIHEYREVYKIEPLLEGRYRVFWKDPRKDATETGNMTCDVLVCGAGAIGSTQLLLQNKWVHETLPELSGCLGKHYFTNGDYVTFLVPKRGLLSSWIGLLVFIVGCVLSNVSVLAAGAIAYVFGWIISKGNHLPDIGSTNSDYIRFRHRDGSSQGMYIEGGRYPTPIKALAAIAMSLTGNYAPEKYGRISNVVNFLGKYFPVFELIERSWPIPLLMMGRDDAVGTFRLDKKQEVEILFPFSKNDQYVKYLEKWGRIFSKKANSYFIPNFFAKALKIVEVPHNMGGCTMGEDIVSGVVDSRGRVFGYQNLMVLDGSIMPVSLGPNPALSILAFSERAMDEVVSQYRKEGKITTDSSRLGNL